MGMTAEAKGTRSLHERLHDEMIETVDEELEMEIDDDRLAGLLKDTHGQPHDMIDRYTYFKELLRLQRELIKLQDWVVHQRLKVVVPVRGA
jgi:polyphosphate kinase